MSFTKHRSNESVEDYLETILLLQKKNGSVRSIDIVTELGYTKASISIAMKGLREKEYITVADTGHISLTDKGLSIAERILERHTLLTEWLIRLGVSEENARKDACRIEHDICEETFTQLKKHCSYQ